MGPGGGCCTQQACLKDESLCKLKATKLGLGSARLNVADDL